MLEFISQVVLMTMFFILGINTIRAWRKGGVVIIDIEAIADINAIIERGITWAENTQNGSFEDYIKAHILEQQPIPANIRKALYYQWQGYTLKFVTTRPNYLRPETAKFLNDWGLGGWLYMREDKETMSDFAYKVNVLSELSHRFRIVGVIDNDTNFIKNYKKLRLTIL